MRRRDAPRWSGTLGLSAGSTWMSGLVAEPGAQPYHQPDSNKRQLAHNGSFIQEARSRRQARIVGEVATLLV